ncbi:hypothetical protein PV11_09092 [Exophiala sideris]|uniref:Uncharacterized protein n=1 Tax=Exophiala sideris TaxID=1016849 RepID=A0A0D1WQA8_9EURO|nr:hypothetical protein PV11_09092 [Exophiala sideris]
MFEYPGKRRCLPYSSTVTVAMVIDLYCPHRVIGTLASQLEIINLFMNVVHILLQRPEVVSIIQRDHAQSEQTRHLENHFKSSLLRELGVWWRLSLQNRDKSRSRLQPKGMNRCRVWILRRLCCELTDARKRLPKLP